MAPSNGVDADPPRATNGGNTLSLDAILALLASTQRRDVLEYLIGADDDVTSVDDLIANLVRTEGERTGEIPSHDHVEVTLFNVHIPKLADAMVVEYDERSRQIRYWPDQRLERWLALVEDENGN